MGAATSAPVYIAELYDIYAQVLAETLDVSAATTHIQDRLENFECHLHPDYPSITLLFPEKTLTIHLNQVYTTPEGTYHVIITLTPYLNNTPYILVNPGEAFGTGINPLLQASYLPKALKWLPLAEPSRPEESRSSKTATSEKSSSTKDASLSLASEIPSSESKSRSDTSKSSETKTRNIPVQWDLKRKWNHPLDFTLDEGCGLEFFSTDTEYTLVECNSTWQNGNSEHTLKLQPGQKLRVSFQKKGTYYYTDKANPQMRLRVKVV
jgi:plastocyanin